MFYPTLLFYPTYSHARIGCIPGQFLLYALRLANGRLGRAMHEIKGKEFPRWKHADLSFPRNKGEIFSNFFHAAVF